MSPPEHLITLELSSKVDTRSRVCIVGRENAVTHPLKRALKVTGFTDVSVVGSLDSVASRTRLDQADIILAHLEGQEAAIREFLRDSEHLETSSPLILVTDSMDIENLFSYLALGAKAFLLLPFSVSSMEEVLCYAQHASELDPDLLSLENRNKAFSACLLNNLQRTARALRRNINSIISDKEYFHYAGAFRHSAKLAKDFRLESDEALRNEIVDTLIAKAQRLDTRLQRSRRELERKRKSP